MDRKSALLKQASNKQELTTRENILITQKKNKKIRTKWFQKKENAGIFCNWRSDVDEGTKRNLVKNLENKVKKLTTEEKVKKKL